MSLVCALGFGFTPADVGLLVMPLCHANSLWFGQAITALGGTAVIYSRPSFDPELLLRLFAEERVSFASLVPTHYIMTLGLPAATLARYDVSGVRRLLISSAPARLDIKQAILDHFRNTGLFEAYGSTEARLGDGAAARGAVRQARLDRARVAGDERDPAARRGRCAGGAGRGRRALLRHAGDVPGLLEPAGEDGGGLPRTAGARWATWPGATQTATTTSPTGGRT